MLRAARQSAKGRGVSLALVLRQELVSPSVPIWLKLGYRRFRAAFSPSRTIVNSSFARRTGLADLIREFDLRGESELDGRIVAVNRINGGFLSGARWAGSGACGVEVSHVPLDRRIIEFCIGVPLSEFSLNGVPRSLFRRAFSGILPDSVVRRQTKGAFAPDFAARVRRDAPGAELLLRQARSGLVGEYLDISSLSDWLRRTGSGESLANSAILETVCLGMRLACFLEHFEIKKPSGAGSRPFKNFVKGC